MWAKARFIPITFACLRHGDQYYMNYPDERICDKWTSLKFYDKIDNQIDELFYKTQTTHVTRKILDDIIDIAERNR